MFKILYLLLFFIIEIKTDIFVVPDLVEESSSTDVMKQNSLSVFVANFNQDPYFDSERCFYFDVNDKEMLKSLMERFLSYGSRYEFYARDGSSLIRKSLSASESDLLFADDPFVRRFKLDRLENPELEANNIFPRFYTDEEIYAANLDLSRFNKKYLIDSVDLLRTHLFKRGENKVCIALLLAFNIVEHFKYKNDLELDKQISLIGYGVQGGQIVHMASFFLEYIEHRSQSSSLSWLIIQLSVACLPLGPVEKGLILAAGNACYKISVELRKKALELTERLVGYNPLFLDRARDVLSSIVKERGLVDVYKKIRIKNMFTVGSTFIPGSFLPNLKIVDSYVNCFSTLNLKNTLVTNNFEEEVATGDVLWNWNRCKDKILNLQVKSKEYCFCSFSYESLWSQKKMLRNMALFKVICNLIVKHSCLKTSGLAKLILNNNPDILDEESSFEIIPLDKNSGFSKCKNNLLFCLCCGCCFRK